MWIPLFMKPLLLPVNCCLSVCCCSCGHQSLCCADAEASPVWLVDNVLLPLDDCCFMYFPGVQATMPMLGHPCCCLQSMVPIICQLIVDVDIYFHCCACCHHNVLLLNVFHCLQLLSMLLAVAVLAIAWCCANNDAATTAACQCCFLCCQLIVTSLFLPVAGISQVPMLNNTSAAGLLSLLLPPLLQPLLLQLSIAVASIAAAYVAATPIAAASTATSSTTATFAATTFAAATFTATASCSLLVSIAVAARFF